MAEPEDNGRNEDVARTPGAGADAVSEIARFVPADLLSLYEGTARIKRTTVICSRFERSTNAILSALLFC
jgi:hypothetical protein